MASTPTWPFVRMLNSFVARIGYLECTKCGQHFSADRPQTVCPKDGGVLYVRYDLAALKKTFPAASLAGRTPNMWRYAEVLPEAEPVSLGEGFTPMLQPRVSHHLHKGRRVESHRF